MVDVGDTIEHYRVERILHRGPVGVVVEATQLRRGDRVALKILLAHTAELIARWRREAMLLASAASDHVVCVLDAGVTANMASYTALEFLDGSDLGHSRRGLGTDAILELARQACVGLAALHARGIVHRDIKPGHLFVTTRPDGTPRLKLLDLRSALVHGVGGRVASQALIGTPSYMAPEQLTAAGDADPRSDLWSLGVVLYELLEGRLPFAADSTAEVTAQVLAEPPARMTARVPAAARKLVTRCLAKDPAQRFQTAAELMDALAGSIR